MARSTEVQIIKALPGETAVAVHWSEDQKEKLAALSADGETDIRALSVATGLTFFQVKQALRSREVRGMIQEELQAKATSEMGRVLSGAIADTEDKNPRARADAREFVLRVHNGEASVTNQINNVHAWDPSMDEKLFERAQAFFGEQIPKIVDQTIEKIAEGSDE